MTDRRMVPQPPRSAQPRLAAAAHWQAAQRIEVLVEILKTFEEDPTSLSTADLDTLRQWATRCYVGSRRLGPYALVEAKAREAAAAHVRMRHHEDATRDETMRDHFDAGLGVYHAVLESGGEPLSRDEDDETRADGLVGCGCGGTEGWHYPGCARHREHEASWHLVKVQNNRSGIAISIDFVCPVHFGEFSARMGLPTIPPGRSEIGRDDGRTTIIVRRIAMAAHTCVLCAEDQTRDALADAEREAFGPQEAS